MIQKVDRRPHTVEAYACTGCKCRCSCACDGGKEQYSTQYKNYGANFDIQYSKSRSSGGYQK